MTSPKITKIGRLISGNSCKLVHQSLLVLSSGLCWLPELFSCVWQESMTIARIIPVRRSLEIYLPLSGKRCSTCNWIFLTWTRRFPRFRLRFSTEEAVEDDDVDLNENKKPFLHRFEKSDKMGTMIERTFISGLFYWINCISCLFL